MEDMAAKMDREIAAGYLRGKDDSPWCKKERGEIGKYIGYLLKTRLSSNGDSKTLVMSVAANVGIMEKGMQSELGNSAIVIASDYVIPPEQAENGLIADARSLPYKKGSVPVIVDIAGALWHQLAPHELLEGESEKDPMSLLSLLNHYLEMLKPGGLLVIDERIVAQAGPKISTAELLDKIVGNQMPQGFTSPETAGDRHCKIRIYKKQSQKN